MIRFSEHLVMDGFKSCRGLAVADLDADGHPGITSPTPTAARSTG